MPLGVGEADIFILRSSPSAATPEQVVYREGAKTPRDKARRDLLRPPTPEAAKL
jgi:hypothetical protein